jgi:sulfotransferase
MKKIYFISGLPRSGSTLLSAILMQNPMCYASITSPVHLVTTQLTHIDQIGTNQLLTNEKLRLLIKSAIEISYNDIDKPIIFDTNRSWTGCLEMLNSVVDDLKIICCVRSISDILNSFERVYQENMYHTDAYVYNGSTLNVYCRCDNLMKWDGAIGRDLATLKSALHSNFLDNLYLMEYDSLVSDPKNEMKNIYNFLGMDEYDHNFDNLQQFSYATAVDTQLNLVGLHKIQESVKINHRKNLIPADLLYQYINLEYWRHYGTN